MEVNRFGYVVPPRITPVPVPVGYTVEIPGGKGYEFKKFAEGHGVYLGVVSNYGKSIWVHVDVLASKEFQTVYNQWQTPPMHW